MQFKKTLMTMMMFSAAAAQADYRAEIGLGLSYDSEEYDYDNYLDEEYDTDSVTFGGVVYLQDVSTAQGPLAEADFLSKSSGIALEIGSADVEVDDGEDKYDYDLDLKVLSGHFVIPGPNFFVEAALGQGDRGEIDIDVLSLGFGGYINDRISLLVSYSELKFDDDYGDDSIKSMTLTYKQLIQLSGEQNLAITPYVSNQDYFGDDAAELGIDVTWYITRALGITAGVSGFAREADDGDYSKGKSHIGVDYFVTENVRIGGALLSSSGEFDADDSYEDYESEGGGIEFNAAVRF